jgi:hypothetical protein
MQQHAEVQTAILEYFSRNAIFQEKLFTAEVQTAILEYFLAQIWPLNYFSRKLIC